MGFSEFYSTGGVWMHAITFSAAASLASLAAHQFSRSHGPAKARYLRLVAAWAGLGLLLGLLGTLFGAMDFFAVLRRLEDPAMFPKIVGRGGGLLFAPLMYAVMCAIPALVAAAATSFLAARAQETTMQARSSATPAAQPAS